MSECDEGPHPLEANDDDGEAQPTKIEVSNVPDSIKEEVLKRFFEGCRSGGCSGAVADITMIRPGVFHVTFHDPKGVNALMCLATTVVLNPVSEILCCAVDMTGWIVPV